MATQQSMTSLEARLRGKHLNSARRRLECTLTMNDMEMMKNPLMGKGVCDYTGLPFSTDRTSPHYPSLERIDHLKGYIRGNVCVVGVGANSAKDSFIDNNHDLSRADKDVQDLVALMKERLTPEYMESLKVKYLPKKCTPKSEPYRIPLNINILNDNSGDNMNEDKNIKAETNPMISENVITLEVQETPEKVTITALPVDVVVAQNYAPFCKAMSEAGFKVEITYAQFKSIYTTKSCHFTRRPLQEKDKFVFVLDKNKPIRKDNVRVTYPEYAAAMTTLMEVSGQSVSGIAVQLTKFKG